jgi:hypothetical protein
MTIAKPYPEDLVKVARKVVWYEESEESLGDVRTFLAQLMVYGSAADVVVVEYVPAVSGSIGGRAGRSVLRRRGGNVAYTDGNGGGAIPAAPVTRRHDWTGGRKLFGQVSRRRPA